MKRPLSTLKVAFLVGICLSVLLLAELASAAPGIAYKRDSFEDGDYTASPAWSVVAGDSMSVTSSSPLNGTYSLIFAGQNTDGWEKTTFDVTDFAMNDTLEVFFSFLETAGTNSDMEVVVNGSAAASMIIEMQGGLSLKARCGHAGSAATTLATFSEGVEYGVWATYNTIALNWTVRLLNSDGTLNTVYNSYTCDIGTQIDRTDMWFYDDSAADGYRIDDITYFDPVSTPAADPGSTSSYTVNVSDLFDDSRLQSATATFYNSTSGTIGTNTTDSNGLAKLFLTNGSAPASLLVNVTRTNWTNVTGATLAVNGTNYVNLTQGVYRNVSIFTLITNSTVPQPFNISVQGGKNYTLTGATTAIYLRAGAMNLTFSKTGSSWNSFTFQKNVTPLTNTTTSASGAYDALLTVRMRNGYTLANLTNFTANISNATYSYNASVATTNGTAIFPMENGTRLYIVGDATNYALANTTVTVNSSAMNVTLDAYTSNSVLVNIYDEDTGLVITQNITILVSGTNYSTTNYTATGVFFVDGLTDGAYTFSFYNANYTLKSYDVTVATRSSQTLNAYLTLSTSQTVFTFRDRDSLVSLEGVDATMSRLLNGTWTLVESKTSDITGSAQWTYTPGIKYRFTASLDGYTSRVFDLNPILFSTYNVDLEKVVSLENASDLIGVTIIYTPRSFSSDDTGNFSFIISSPSGVLISYGANITYPLGSQQDTGVNANGETFTLPYNLTGATASDTLTLRYWYNSTVSGYRTYTVTFRIRGIYGTTSIEALKDNHFGLGLLERVLIGTVLTIILAGVAAMVGGALTGGVVAILTMGLLIYIGLYPLWVAVVAIVLGFIILANKGGD